jgi:hypothetical protein
VTAIKNSRLSLRRKLGSCWRNLSPMAEGNSATTLSLNSLNRTEFSITSRLPIPHNTMGLQSVQTGPYLTWPNACYCSLTLHRNGGLRRLRRHVPLPTSYLPCQRVACHLLSSCSRSAPTTVARGKSLSMVARKNSNLMKPLCLRPAGPPKEGLTPYLPQPALL